MEFKPNTITLALKGLMVLFTQKADECTIGLLRDAPPVHNKRIVITERSGPVDFTERKAFNNDEVAGEFRLDVTGTTSSGIRRRDERRVDRANEADSESFGWLLDFNTELPLSPPIRPIAAGFFSIVKVNSGEIFTNRVSDNKLAYRLKESNEWVAVGRVAVETGIEIKLDNAGSEAVFTKVGEPPIPLELGKEYRIHIERTDSTFDPRHVDANSYFTALETGAGGDQPMFFKSFMISPDEAPPQMPKLYSTDDPLAEPPSPPSTPDATCPVTQLSQSGGPT